jgi:hypothetical protein
MTSKGCMMGAEGADSASRAANHAGSRSCCSAWWNLGVQRAAKGSRRIPMVESGECRSLQRGAGASPRQPQEPQPTAACLGSHPGGATWTHACLHKRGVFIALFLYPGASQWPALACRKAQVPQNMLEASAKALTSAAQRATAPASCGGSRAYGERQSGHSS